MKGRRKGVINDEQQNKIADDLEKEEREQLHRVVLALSQQSFEIKRLLATILIAMVTVCGVVFRDNYQLLIENRLYVCIAALFIILLFWIKDTMANFYGNRLRVQIDILRNDTLKRYESPEKNTYLIKLAAKPYRYKLQLFIRFSKIFTGSYYLYYAFLALIVIFVIFIPFERIF